MSNRSWGGVVGCAWLLSVGACGQELVLPTARHDIGGAGAPDEGFTGPHTNEGGVAATGRLPIPDRPSFSTFGGYGGADMGGDAGEASSGGSGDVSEPKASKGGGGGNDDSGVGGSSTPGNGLGSNGGAAGASLETGGTGAVSTGGAGGTPPWGGAAGGGSANLPPQLWFSEYVEGSGSYKALEIYAAQAASLEGCELETYFNGKADPARLALHGALESGGVQVLCSTALAAQLPAQCGRTTSLTFNGNDAIALRCSGTLLDVIGEIGVDPGTAWADGATLDHTLRRRCSVKAGNPTPAPGFEPDAEWETFGVDTFTDLGRHDCAP